MHTLVEDLLEIRCLNRVSIFSQEIIIIKRIQSSEVRKIHLLEIHDEKVNICLTQQVSGPSNLLGGAYNLLWC